MLLTNNELGSQNIEEFLNLLEEYSKSVHYTDGAYNILYIIVNIILLEFL